MNILSRVALSAGAKRRFGSCDSDYPPFMGEYYYSKWSRGKEIIFDKYSKKIFLKIRGVIKRWKYKEKERRFYTCTHAGNQPFFPYLSPQYPVYGGEYAPLSWVSWLWSHLLLSSLFKLKA